MEQSQLNKRNSMATASLVMGVISLISIFTITYSGYAYFFACMSILFAVLSKGSGLKMPDKAIGGFVTSILSIVLITVLLAFGTFILVKMFGLETVLDPDALQAAINDLIEKFSSELPTDFLLGGKIL